MLPMAKKQGMCACHVQSLQFHQWSYDLRPSFSCFVVMLLDWSTKSHGGAGACALSCMRTSCSQADTLRAESGQSVCRTGTRRSLSQWRNAVGVSCGTLMNVLSAGFERGAPSGEGRVWAQVSPVVRAAGASGSSQCKRDPFQSCDLPVPVTQRVLPFRSGRGWQ